MKMRPVDAVGVLYSSGGIRFGGYQTSQFIDLTAELELIRPDAQEEIVAEAHYLAIWLHTFPAIAFLIGTVWTRSLLIGFLWFVGAFLFEAFRFYAFGASPVMSHLSRLWEWLKWPSFLISAILLWPEGWVIPLALVGFLILQGWLKVITTVLFLPMRIGVAYLGNRALLGIQFNEQQPAMEGLAMQWVIDRWQKKHEKAIESLRSGQR
jgi:hypothetical protein